MNPDTIHRRRWIILGIMSLSLVITLINNVTVNVAFVEGMTGAAAISAIAAIINAILVKLYMPNRLFGEETPDGR